MERERDKSLEGRGYGETILNILARMYTISCNTLV